MHDRTLPIVLMAAVVVGCAGTSDRNRTEAEGSAVGGAVGFGVSQAIGWLPGGPTLKRSVGAATVVSSAAAGAKYGEHVATRKAEFATQEDYLEACLAHAVSTREELEAYNETLAQELDALDRQADQLAAQIEQESTTLRGQQDLQKEIGRRLDRARDNLGAVDEEIRIQREVMTQERDAGGDDSYLAQLEQQIRELEDAKAVLSTHMDRLASLGERVSL